MIKFKEYIPTKAVPFRAKTKYGIRTVQWENNNGFWTYIDCTNPMQNCYCAESDIIEWEYLDQQYMDQLCFVENKWYKLEELRKTERLLVSIKVTKTDKILFYIDHFLRKFNYL